MYFCSPHQRKHTSQIERFIGGITQKWIKISPKRGQHFRKELQYVENSTFIEDRRVCVKPLKNRFETFEH